MATTSHPVRPRPPLKRAGRVGLTDSASTALSGPGSTSVSCMLMEDVIASGDVSVGLGAGKVALFANPYLRGKEEALIVDANGKLTYLQRAGADSGWLQLDVTGGGTSALNAAEVVVVVHPEDLSLWAVYSATGAFPGLYALRLTSLTTGGVTSYSWQIAPEVIDNVNGAGGKSPRHLSVYYDGQSPFITGYDPGHDAIITVTTVIGESARFRATNNGNPIPNAGTIVDVAGGTVAAVPGLAAICYAQIGTSLTRYNLTGTTAPEHVADDVAAIAGVFRSRQPEDIGCVYLRTNGDLMTWNPTPAIPGGKYTSAEGLRLTTAASWIDVQGMLHVYGVGPVVGPQKITATALQVLHQASWGKNGEPVWSRTTAQLPPPPPPSSSPSSPPSEPPPDPIPVIACVGLVRDVATFVLDPFPDSLPSQLVRLTGTAATANRYSIHTQDIASTRWSRDEIRLPSSGGRQLVTHYVSSVTVLDRRGTPMASLPVDVTADTLTEIKVDGSSYLVGAGHTVQLTTNAFGKVVIATSADSLLPATLHVDTAGLEHGAIVQPAAAVHEYLAGTGTLPSQTGLFTVQVLADAKVDGVPVVNPARTDAIGRAVLGTQQALAAASGNPLRSAVHSGPGAAPRIHGFAIGSAPGHLRHSHPGAAGYSEFGGPDEVAAHLAEIRRLPEYGGILDDFADWASDVWEGITNGAVEVFDVVVEAVTTMFVWVGEKIVELLTFVIDSVSTALHLVESALRMVVDTIVGVINWLRALFRFHDIWETKQALESGLKTLLGYTSSTVTHFGDVVHYTFAEHKAKVHEYFESVNQQYLGTKTGSAASQITAITDTSGHAVAPPDLHDNPQSTWMLDQAMSASMLTGGEPVVMDISSAVTDAWAAFQQKVTDSGIEAEFTTALGDIAELMKRIVDVGDPELAARSSLSLLLDGLENLIDVVLDALDLMFQAVVVLVSAVVQNLSNDLFQPLEQGALFRLYEWVQDQAEPASRDKPTIAGLICLIGAFTVTTAYKAVNGIGSKPFPGGAFPAIPAPVWDPAYDPDFRGGSDEDHLKDMKLLKFVFGLLGAAGSVTSGIADIAPLLPGPPFPNAGMIIGGTNTLFGATGAMVTSCPPVNGRDWDSLQSGKFAFAGVNAVCCWATLLLHLAGVPGVPPAFKNSLGVKGGPALTAAFSYGSMLCAALDDPPNDYAIALAAMQTIPGISQVFRFGISTEFIEVDAVRAGVVAAIDVLGTATAGFMIAAWRQRQN